MNGIIRVFPKRFKDFTPNDEYSFIGMPPNKQLIPEHKEVHISCNFTWDKQRCEFFKYQWESVTNKPVKIGGVAFYSNCENFIPGMYLKPNIIFTTRGCNNNCPWCIVPKLEGKLRELPIYQGNIIQDNNFLQASRNHKEKVFEMLKTQKGICFKGGLEAHLIDDHFIDGISNLSIKELWLACDTDGALPVFKKAVEKLKKAGFTRDKIRSYALIGDDMQKNEARLQEIYAVGAMPRAQLYRDYSDTKTNYTSEWKQFQHTWDRPPATISHCEKGTTVNSYKEMQLEGQEKFF